MQPPTHLPQTPNARVRAAWQAQLAAASKTLGLLPDLVRHRQKLLPRFAAAYMQLRALPRRVRRMLQKRYKLSVASVALWLIVGQSPSLAALIPVNDTCPLIDAITAANTDAATGECPAGRGADTIVLPANSTQTLISVNNSTHGPTGLPVISSAITIEGQGSTIMREANAPEFRIFAVNNAGDLTLNETTVSGGAIPATEPFPNNTGGGVLNEGALTITHSTLTGNSARSFGGGITNLGTMATVTNSTITGNTGGGVANGLYSTLTITNSTISDNAGGGMLNDGIATVTQSTVSGNAGRGVGNGGIATVTNSTVSGNTGGGVGNGDHGTLTIMNSTISGNTAMRGGGVANVYEARLTIENSTISNNTANGGGTDSDFGLGGGVLNDNSIFILGNSTVSGNSAYQGGGIANYYYSYLNVTASTISGNTADDWGGGVLNSRSGLVTQSTTITGNAATLGGGVQSYGDIDLAHTLISGNTASTGAEIWHRDFASYYDPFIPNNYNLFGLNGDAGIAGLFSPGATDIVPGPGVQLDDTLDPTLADNGGPTLTHALVSGSPAIDAIPLANPGCTGTDQRGIPRPQGAGCDIGAVEFTEETGPLEIQIDINPGSAQNPINPKSKGVIPVALVTTTDFDATTVDPLSVAFGPNGATEAHRRGHVEDVNRDGRSDLVLHFQTQETSIQCGDTSASLTGETFAGDLIQGADMIRIVGCR